VVLLETNLVVMNDYTPSLPDQTPLVKADGSVAAQKGGFEGPSKIYAAQPKVMEHVSDWQRNFGRLMAMKHHHAADVKDTKESKPDFEGAFHALASQKDPGDLSDDLKKQILEILTYVKQRTPQLEALKQSAPDIYASVRALIQAMIAITREVIGGKSESDIKKSEDFIGGEGSKEPDSEFDPDQLVSGTKDEMHEHNMTAAQAKKIAKDHLLDKPDYYKKDEDLGKSVSAAAYRHKTTGQVHETGLFHDRTELPHPEEQYDRGFMHSGKFHTTQEARAQNLIPKARHMHKDEVAPTPALHSDVNNFMTGLKALPRGTPQRGLYIQQHMNHPAFLTALQNHPQGKQVHGMLTGFMNGVANAGLHNAPKVTMKAETLPKPKLPVGTVLDCGPTSQHGHAGKIKVQTPDGAEHWRGARSGLKMGADRTPTGARPEPKA